MSFQFLKSYLLEGMKMSHVYQPVMIKRLLLGHGSAKVEEMDVKVRMVRNYIKFMKDHEIIEKNTNGNGVNPLPFLPF
jgi:hypothetical protein